MGKIFSLFISTNEICLSETSDSAVGAPRRAIAGFSRQSKTRMTRFMNSLVFERFEFVTLTFRYNLRDWSCAYKMLRLWYKSMSYNFGPALVIWRQELQDRGAIHFHTFIVDYPEEWTHANIVEKWLSVTKQRGDTAARQYGVETKTFDRLETKDAGIICSYLAKYTAKDGTYGSGKQWGIMGRGYARTTQEKRRVSRETAKVMFEAFRLAGFDKLPIDGGGSYTRFYLGHLGSIAGSAPRDALKKFATNYEFEVK